MIVQSFCMALWLNLIYGHLIEYIIDCEVE